MSKVTMTDDHNRWRRWRWLVGAVALVTSVVLAACGSSSDSSTSGSGSGSDQGDSKLIIANMSFPCGLNDFAKSLCAGFEDVESELPPGFEFELNTGIDFADTTKFNNVIQTSQQLDPAGLVIFPNGPSGQVPVLKEACAKGIKVIIIDNPVKGLGSCQTSYIAADNYNLGVEIGKWLLEHEPSSKEVGIAAYHPGEASSEDERVDGFTKTVEAAGYEVVSTLSTDLSLDKTRSGITNMLTAHPDLGAIFTSNDAIGDGAAQAIESADADVMLLSVDGSAESVKRIPDGLSADIAQDPYFAARESVLNMVKAIEGKEVPAELTEPAVVIDETNVDEYLEELENR